MRQTRVAIVYDVLYPWVHGGAEKRNWEIARRLPAYGFDAHLIGPKYWDGPPAIQREGVWLHGICPPRPLYGPSGKRVIGEALAFARDLLPALLHLRVDLIDACAFPYFPWLSARTAVAGRGIPLLTTWPEYWGSYWQEYLGTLKGTVAQLVELATAHQSMHHLCPSSFTADRLRRVSPGTPITILPAGIDVEAYAAYAAPREQRSGILYVGRLNDHKRVQDLLHAVVRVRQKAPDLAVTIVGSGPEEASLRKLAGDLDISEAVSFRADLADSELKVLLGRSLCLVLPSEREGQGIVVAEAQATGTPVIVARGPETAATDFVHHGDSGLIYSVGDREALAQALFRVHEDTDIWARLSAGASRAAATLDWDSAILPRLAELYGTLLQSQRKQSALGAVTG